MHCAIVMYIEMRHNAWVVSSTEIASVSHDLTLSRLMVDYQDEHQSSYVWRENAAAHLLYSKTRPSATISYTLTINWTKKEQNPGILCVQSIDLVWFFCLFDQPQQK